MRFLIEASQEANKLASREAYFKLGAHKSDSIEEKEKFIESRLNNPNINEKNFAYYIAKDDDIYYEDHPLYKIAQRIPKKIGPITEYTILELGSNGNQYSKTLSKADFLNSLDLYSDEDANVAWKIKALTLAQDNKINLDKFKNDGHWLSINKFKQIATNYLLPHASKQKLNNGEVGLRVRKLAKASNKPIEKVANVVKQADNKLSILIDKLSNELSNIQGIPINKKDAKDFVESSLKNNPNSSIDDLLLNYLKQLG